MKTENLRFYIKIRTKLGFDANSIFKDLKSTMGESAPSLSTVIKFDFIKQRLTDATGAESLETQITKILEDIPRKRV